MRNLFLSVAAVGTAFALAASAEAQVYVTHYTPATAYYAPVVTYRPAVAPVTTYYAPAAAGVPVTTYYAPAPTVAYSPVTVATRRYRPILGGTVTRYRTAYSPVVVNPAPVVFGY